MMRDSVKGSLFVGRNFYGGLKVTQYNGYYDWTGYRSLAHGSINHGEQYTHPARHRKPTTYYCPDTGAGRFLASSVVGTPQRVAIIGLGTGTLAAYGRPGDLYTFYEINPMVPVIAKTYFTYLKDSDALVDIHMGDARLSLEREQPQNYDLIAVDAFSSDSIPVHLLTREALQLYFKHLSPEGVLAVHISNRYVDLEPVLERGAAAIGNAVRVYETDDNDDETCYGTTWVLFASDPAIFNREELKSGVRPKPAPWLKTWTDDYSNVYKVLRERHK
jgi:predicted O-methyltransferase YrrM